MHDQPKAFVIMPFEAEFESIYSKLIKAPLVEAGYEVTRADSLLDQRNILSDIVRGITTADLIVADLTTNNPNVFYELGLCHGLGLPTILLAQSINDVPFDLQSYKILVYETHFDKIDKLRSKLKDIAEKHRTKAIEFGNPVKDFSNNASVPSPTPTEKNGITDSCPSVEDAEEKEFLDYLVDSEKASSDLTNILTRLLKDNEIVTSRITKHAAGLQALSNNPVAGSAGKFHKIALLAASDMNNFSKKVEDMLPSFEEAISRLDENYTGSIRTADPETRKKEDLERFVQTINGLLNGSQEAKKGMASYRDAVLGIGEKKLSKDLSRASRRQAEALNGIISNIQRVVAFCEKTLMMVDDKFADYLN